MAYDLLVVLELYLLGFIMILYIEPVCAERVSEQAGASRAELE
jgi:hypothetical protein